MHLSEEVSRRTRGILGGVVWAVYELFMEVTGGRRKVGGRKAARCGGGGGEMDGDAAQVRSKEEMGLVVAPKGRREVWNAFGRVVVELYLMCGNHVALLGKLERSRT